MQSRRWCFTINNPGGTEEVTALVSASSYLIYGAEVSPSSGTPHFQGYCFLNKKTALAGMRKLHPRAHFEAAKGTHQQASDYCKKEGHFLEFGTFPEEPAVTGRKFWQEFISSAKAGTAEETHPQQSVQYHCYVDKAIRANPPKVETVNEDLKELNFWYFGPSGCGKSKTARTQFPDYFDKAINKWWDGYRHQTAVILDDLDKSHACLGHYIKRWADRYPFQAEVKGSHGYFRPRHIVVTSQYSIDQIWDDAETREAMHRRFKEVNLDPNYSSIHPFFIETTEELRSDAAKTKIETAIQALKDAKKELV